MMFKSSPFLSWTTKEEGWRLFKKIRQFGAAVWGTNLSQRAENGALDAWLLDLRLGCPRFFPRIAPKSFKIRVLGPLD